MYTKTFDATESTFGESDDLVLHCFDSPKRFTGSSQELSLVKTGTTWLNGFSNLAWVGDRHGDC